LAGIGPAVSAVFVTQESAVVIAGARALRVLVVTPRICAQSPAERNAIGCRKLPCGSDFECCGSWRATRRVLASPVIDRRHGEVALKVEDRSKFLPSGVLQTRANGIARLHRRNQRPTTAALVSVPDENPARAVQCIHLTVDVQSVAIGLVRLDGVNAARGIRVRCLDLLTIQRHAACWSWRRSRQRSW